MLLLQIFSVGLAAMIPLGAAAERWRLGASCIVTVLLAGWIYPLFAHWVLSGGWLSQIGSLYGLGEGFVDGGAGSLQVIGGLSALSIAWTLGPRQGKYPSGEAPSAIPAHNIVLALTGSMFAWMGWMGLNSASAVLFGHSGPSYVILIVINTTLSAAASAWRRSGDESSFRTAGRFPGGQWMDGGAGRQQCSRRIPQARDGYPRWLVAGVPWLFSLSTSLSFGWQSTIPAARFRCTPWPACGV